MKPVIERRQRPAAQLAKSVAALGLVNPLVVALPRGGVSVGVQIARALDAPLDFLLPGSGVPGSGTPGPGRAAVLLVGRSVVLADDGRADRGALRQALDTLRQMHPACLVLAMPVTRDDIAPALCGCADQVVHLVRPAGTPPEGIPERRRAGPRTT